MKTLIACGDSWTWGAELVDPAEEPVPLFKIGGDQHWREHKPINVEYRNNHRYIKLFAEKINAEEIIDLSQPSISNRVILKKLRDWLAIEGYLTGNKNTEELFVSIGWSSPERTEFLYRNPNTEEMRNIVFGPWVFSCPDQDPEVDTFLKTYAINFSHAHEFMHRYINELWQTQLLLNHFNIKYVMHQAFYHFLDKWFYSWNDQEYLNNTKGVLSPEDRILWENIDNIRFMHKNDEIMSAHNYMQNKAKIELGDDQAAFIVMHPSEYGHKVWAEHMFEYCVENKLL